MSLRQALELCLPVYRFGRMSMGDALREQNPLIVGVSVAVVSGIIGFFIATYSANYGAQITAQNAVAVAQAADLQGQALKIQRLESDDSNTQTSIASLNAAVGQLSGIKPALEALTRAFDEQSKKVDAIDHWLRPDPTLGSHAR